MIKVPAYIRGFSLITTLFLLVVVSGLAAYLVNLSIAQQYSTALSISALRGRHAALSGLEWVAYRINNVSASCPPIPSSMTIEGFNVSVTGCAETSVTEGMANYSLFDITVSAERGAFGDADYVNHAIRATLRG
jgi:MSHA biogenesis protein MshP